MQRRNRGLVPILLLVIGMLASVGTSSAARVCLQDEFGGRFILNGDGGVLTGLFSIDGDPVAVVMGSRTRDDSFTVFGLHFAANCPLLGGVSLTLVIDRFGEGFATGFGTDCDGEHVSFCDDFLEGKGEPLCDEPAIEVSRCSDRQQESSSRHPLLSP